MLEAIVEKAKWLICIPAAPQGGRPNADAKKASPRMFKRRKNECCERYGKN